MNIEKYGFHPLDLPENPKGIPARITSVCRGYFEIACEKGPGLAHLKTGEYREKSGNLPAAGDFVLLDWQPWGQSRILKTLPRKTYFSRLDPSSSGWEEQAVAANFDYVFILQSLDRNFNLRRLERYLTLSWQSGAIPAIILTKGDCAEEEFRRTSIRAAQRLAPSAGVFAISAKTGCGLSDLSEYLKPGKTIVLLGSSGVGKSTLLNALAGKEIMTTGCSREKDGRGRHTTSRRQLTRLENGVMVIDTPGMRELGMWNASEGLSHSFADVEQYLDRCRFRNCSHKSEPGCAVTEALRHGELSPERWESYQRLQDEMRFTDDKNSFLREKEQWRKEIAKQQREKRSAGFQCISCMDRFPCKECGALITPDTAGSQHRNHCPHCLCSIHADNRPGDRASLCRGIMDPIGVWVRNGGEWAIIHRCRSCGALSSNRIAADDNIDLLLAIAAKPLENPPIPFGQQAP